MITEYLESRKEELTRIISVDKEKYEHNQIAIGEAKEKIKELENTEDEATKIFSVKTRKNNTYNVQEIRQLEGQILNAAEASELLKQEYEAAEKELKTIQACFTEWENVSRETSIKSVSRETSTGNGLRETSTENISHEVLTENDLREASTENISHEVSTENVSRENKTDQIRRTLELCKNLAQVDGARVAMELERLLRQL